MDQTDANNSKGAEPDIAALHQGLIDQLKHRGLILTPAIENAFRMVPRHLFLPQVALEEVYSDEAIATKSLDERVVSSSSQPAIMAIMLEQLQLAPGQRVLEIGAGTGYNAALIAQIIGETGQVVTIDIDEDIVEDARKHLVAAGFDRVQVVWADGFHGYPDVAPYDRIILTVNASDLAPAWLEQLSPDGRIVLPLSVNGPQVSVAFVRVGDHWESDSLSGCGFVGLRGVLAEPGTHMALPGCRATLHFMGQRAVDAQEVCQWLRGAYQDTILPLQVNYHELYYGLNFWMSLKEPLFCGLTAPDVPDEPGFVPVLLHYTGKSATVSTWGLLGEEGFSALLRDPAYVESADSSWYPLAFPLWIRSFGLDRTLADRLREHITDWNLAGRPDERHLHVLAYPVEGSPVYDETDKRTTVVTKQWMRFIFRWR
jgi:protein-L-isoaspartate(D-aspartate) O-methyltransferase